MMDRSLNDTKIFGMNNKNTEAELGLNLNIRKAKATKPLENSYHFEIIRLKENKILSHLTL